MSEDLSEKYGINYNDYSPGNAPGWGNDPNGNPFSKQQNPALFSKWQATIQDTPKMLIQALKETPGIPISFLKSFEIAAKPQEYKDGLLAAITADKAVQIQAQKNVDILIARMRCYPDIAYDPVVISAESSRREHISYVHSRDQRDEFNERNKQIEESTLSAYRGEVKHMIEEQKKPGILGVLKGGKN